MSSPTDVVGALSNPNFYQNHAQFWHLLRFLFTDYQGRKVHTYIDIKTYRSMIQQLRELIESIEAYDTLLANSELIYHVYFTCLANIRGPRSVQEMHGYESPDILMALYQVFKMLHRFGKWELPCFGHPTLKK